MITTLHNTWLDAPQPLPFPVDVARAIETPAQRQRVLRQEQDRSLRALAAQLGCFGWFDPSYEGPRAA